MFLADTLPAANSVSSTSRNRIALVFFMSVSVADRWTGVAVAAKQRQTPVRRRAVSASDANRGRSGARVARALQRGAGAWGQEIPGGCRSIGEAQAARRRAAADGFCIRNFAGVAHVSPGKRRSVGCDAIMRMVKETLGKCRLQIRPRFARNMYGAAPLRTLITQTDETIPVAPRSSRDRRNPPRRRPPNDS